MPPVKSTGEIAAVFLMKLSCTKVLIYQSPDDASMAEGRRLRSRAETMNVEAVERTPRQKRKHLLQSPANMKRSVYFRMLSSPC